MYGFVLESLLEWFFDNEKLIVFVKGIFLKVVKSYCFFYIYCDFEREGLMFIFYLWELGWDNLLLWDELFDCIEVKKEELLFYEC